MPLAQMKEQWVAYCHAPESNPTRIGHFPCHNPWKLSLLLVNREANGASLLERTEYGRINSAADTLLLSGCAMSSFMLSKMRFSNIESLALSTRIWFRYDGDMQNLEDDFVEGLLFESNIHTLILIVRSLVSNKTPNVNSPFIVPRQRPEEYGLRRCEGDTIEAIWSAKERSVMDTVWSKRKDQYKQSSGCSFSLLIKFLADKNRRFSK
jgi:hypothetical protein